MGTQQCLNGSAPMHITAFWIYQKIKMNKSLICTIVMKTVETEKRLNNSERHTNRGYRWAD